MSTVNYETGEIVETITRDEAHRLTSEARNEFRSSADHFGRGWTLIEEAVKGGGHIALGYRSPSDYLHEEFDGVLGDFDTAARRIAVRELDALGISKRASAEVLGVSHPQISKDRAAIAGGNSVTTSSGEESDTPGAFVGPGEHIPSGEPLDTTTPAPSTDGEAEVGAGHTSQGGATTPDTPRPAPITGRDGKQYKRPEPKPAPKPKRKPLPDTARTAGWELHKAVERLERITDDDRFNANKEAVAPHLRSHLQNAVEVCQDLLARIDN